MIRQIHEFNRFCGSNQLINIFQLSYPLGLILDKCLGDETPTVYDKERLIEYIKLTRPINKLEKDQLDMISGVVYLRDKTVGQAMTKLKDVYMISHDTILTQCMSLFNHSAVHPY